MGKEFQTEFLLLYEGGDEMEWSCLTESKELTEPEERKCGYYFKYTGKHLKDIVISDKWQSSEDIICFLHEVGHVIYYEKNPNLFEKKFEIESEQFKIMKWLPEIDKTPKDEKKHEEYKKRCKELRIKYVKILAQLERNAWAEALRLARKLKRDKNIDLLKPFRDKETNKLNFHKLKEIIHEISLGSYEHDTRLDIKKGLAPEDLKGIFTRKYKE